MKFKWIWISLFISTSAHSNDTPCFVYDCVYMEQSFVLRLLQDETPEHKVWTNGSGSTKLHFKKQDIHSVDVKIVDGLLLSMVPKEYSFTAPLATREIRFSHIQKEPTTLFTTEKNGLRCVKRPEVETSEPQDPKY